MKHEEIREKIERTREFLTPGVRYLAFSEFKVKGSKVIVSLDNTYISKKARAFIRIQSFEFEFRKINGKWEGKIIREGGLIT